MSSERRRATLAVNINELDQDIEAEKKGVAGLENLVKVYGEQPSYTNETSMITTQRQLTHLQDYLSILQTNQQTYVDLLGSLGGQRQARVPSTASGNFSPSTPPASSSPATSSPMPSFSKPLCLSLSLQKLHNSSFFLSFLFFPPPYCRSPGPSFLSTHVE